MINIYKDTKNGLTNINSIEENCWIDIISPRYDELNRLSGVFNKVPEEFFTDPLDIDERPRVEVDDDQLLIIARIPISSKKHPESGYITVPFGIILLPNNVITISSVELDVLSVFFNGKIKNFSIEDRKKFVILILLEVAKFYTKYLRNINNSIFQYENKFQVSLNNEDLLQLMKIEKSLVYFTTSLRTIELMISRLSVSKFFLEGLDEDSIDLLEDVSIEYKQNTDMTNVLTNILSRTMYTFVSLISNQLNSTIKIFINVIMCIAIISTSIPVVYIANKILNNIQNMFYYYMLYSFIVAYIFTIAIFFIACTYTIIKWCIRKLFNTKKNQ